MFVFIHGGAFQRGSSTADDWGPDFLVAQDIVVLTMNYRTGIMGMIIDQMVKQMIKRVSSSIKSLIFIIESYVHLQQVCLLIRTRYPETLV